MAETSPDNAPGDPSPVKLSEPVPQPAPPDEAELLADMAATTPEAHQVPEENRAIETTRHAGEYVLGQKKGR
jgi:hypothetical protein